MPRGLLQSPAVRLRAVEREKKTEPIVNAWSRRTLLILTCSVALMGCQSRGQVGDQSTPLRKAPSGDYITVMRELMAESAQLDSAAGDGPERSEQAARAVQVWRSQESDAGESESTETGLQ